MQRKGQVTAFILLGILFLLFIVLVYYSRTEKELGVQPISSKESVTVFVQSCLDTVLLEGIPFIGYQGGYSDFYHAKASYLSSIPYYYFYGENIAPSTEVVEEELTAFLYENLPSCIDNFTVFDYLSIEQETPSFQVTLEPEKVLVDLFFPLTITEDDSITSLNSFTSEQETRFGTLLRIAQAIAEQQEQVGNSIPIGFIMEQAKVNGITFDISYDLSDAVQMTLIDEAEDLRFIFALQYDWEEE